MLTGIGLRNFKPFGDEMQEAPLSKITLIYGPNSGGKSSIIQALLLLKQSLRDSYPNEERMLVTRGEYADFGSLEALVHRHESSRQLGINVNYRGRGAEDEIGEHRVGLKFSPEGNFSQVSYRISSPESKEELLNAVATKTIDQLWDPWNVRVKGTDLDANFEVALQSEFFPRLNFYACKDEVDAASALLSILRETRELAESRILEQAENLEWTLLRMRTRSQFRNRAGARAVALAQANELANELAGELKQDLARDMANCLAIDLAEELGDRIFENIEQFSDLELEEFLELLTGEGQGLEQVLIPDLMLMLDRNLRLEQLQDHLSNRVSELVLSQGASLELRVALEQELEPAIKSILDSEDNWDLEPLDFIPFIGPGIGADSYTYEPDMDLQAVVKEALKLIQVTFDEGEPDQEQWAETELPQQIRENFNLVAALFPISSEGLQHKRRLAVVRMLALELIQGMKKLKYGPLLQQFLASSPESRIAADCEWQLRSINYLGPLRSAPQRIYRLSSTDANTTGIQGEYSANVLFHDSCLRREVNHWCDPEKKEYGFDIPYELDVIPVGEASLAGEYITIALLDKRTNTQVTIADVGYGINQLLPIIIEGVASKEGSILCVEQPEIHLHPRLQASIADLMIDTIADEPGKRKQWVVETHSELLVRRIQTRIAQGDISPSDISVLYVDPDDDECEGSAIKQLCIGYDGSWLDEWPDGFFEEGHDEIMEIVNARLRRRRARIGSD